MRPIDRTERVALAEANGRVLAEDVVATADVPPFARAAMDGYAVRAAGHGRRLEAITRGVLTRVETLFTGQVTQRTVGAGECIEIATGAPMPAGADAVVIVEDTDGEASGGSPRVRAGRSRDRTSAARAPTSAAASACCSAGTTLTPSRVGAIAALGLSRRRGVRAAARRDPLDRQRDRRARQPLAPGQIYDINRFTLAAVVAEHGGVPVPYRTAADTLEDLSRALDAACRRTCSSSRAAARSASAT